MSDKNTESPSVELKRQRIRAALANLFIGDALSMPVHWFYNPGDIIRAFPPNGITRFEAAPEYHPSSIMALHSTSRGGRSRQSGKIRRRLISGPPEHKEIVGDVILKGRRHLWGQPNGHYHHGLQAGDNTLNAWWAIELLGWLNENDHYAADLWVTRYIEFMTADPPAYPDTYAESCHRGFFANWAAGQPATQCGAVTHDTPSMGALVTVAPLALALLANFPLEEVQQQCRQHVWLTHPDNELLHVVDAYVVLLNNLLQAPHHQSNTDHFAEAANVVSGTSLKKLLSLQNGDAFVVGRTYSLACYITDSWPSVCFLAAKYEKTPQKALLINTNLGGENAHRGSVLGTLVGLASSDYDHALFTQLALAEPLNSLIDHFLDRFHPRPQSIQPQKFQPQTNVKQTNVNETSG